MYSQDRGQPLRADEINDRHQDVSQGETFGSLSVQLRRHARVGREPKPSCLLRSRSRPDDGRLRGGGRISVRSLAVFADRLCHVPFHNSSRFLNGPGRRALAMKIIAWFGHTPFR